MLTFSVYEKFREFYPNPSMLILNDRSVFCAKGFKDLSTIFKQCIAPPKYLYFFQIQPPLSGKLPAVPRAGAKGSRFYREPVQHFLNAIRAPVRIYKEQEPHKTLADILQVTRGSTQPSQKVFKLNTSVKFLKNAIYS